MVVASLMLPSAKMVGVTVQTLPSAKVWLLGLPPETSITPKSLFFGRPAVGECLEQPAKATVSDARITSDVYFIISIALNRTMTEKLRAVPPNAPDQ
jgi:hypothetical protein